MIKRVYFGNWLRDYSQAVDVGTLKGIQSGTIRILVWVLSFLSFGYATGEFEVTEERLGVYRPEEHIDNPKDYADGVDARQFDQRLRPPVQPVELQIDPDTGMKNYIANERGGWATSSAFIKQSFSKSIHFGRQYTASSGMFSKGNESDLCEALRCLGQGLHCLEDFGAHTNYTELSLRELGFKGVFPHTGTATEINLRGHRVFPLVTGSFGVVDFLHSVLGEATDHFAQTEVEKMDMALGDAQVQSKNASGGSRGYGAPSHEASYFTSLLSKLPGAGDLCQQAESLQAQADAQEHSNMGASGGQYSQAGAYQGGDRASQPTFAAPPGAPGGPPGPGIPGMNPNFDPMKTAAQIYPILEFRDKVAKAISATIEKIPGLEALVEKITETLTLFVLSLLAPFIRPIINAVSAQLKAGSSTVVDASGKHQYEVWTDPHCSDPTHSLLSKDHFSNILNEPAGQVAASILQYVAPRIIHAWEHPDVPVQQVLDDVVRVFHHPTIRDPRCEIHRNMFEVVQRWVNSRPDRGTSLNDVLGSEGVKQGRNHIGGDSDQSHSHGGLPSAGNFFGASKPNDSAQTHSFGGLPSVGNLFGSGSHGMPGGAPWNKIANLRDAAGLNREAPGQGRDDVRGTADGLAGAYPGTETEYDTVRPVGTAPTEFHPHGDSQHPGQQGYPYDQQQYSSNQGYTDYGGQAPYQQPHQNPYQNQPQTDQYQQHTYQASYQGQPYEQGQGQAQGYPDTLGQYEHDPNNPQRQGQYGYGGPPPPQQQQGQYGNEGRPY